MHLSIERRRAFEPAVAAVVAFVVYAATAARDVQWGDPAKLTLYVWRFNLSLDQDVHLGSLVWAWPFAHLPIGSFAFRVTLASVCASAIAAGFLHAVLLKRSTSPWAARTGTASFVVSHTFWFVSTMPESYPVSVLCIMVAAWLALSWNRLAEAGVVLGAGALANPLTLFGIPAAAWWLWRRNGRRGGRGDPWRFLAGIAIGIGIPVLIASSLSAGSTASTATEWSRVFHAYLNWRTPAQNLPLLVAYFAFNFVGPALFLIVKGVKHIDRDDRVAFFIFAAVHYGVALLYLPQRAYLIPIPLYLAAAWLVAAGADDFMRRHRPSRSWIMFASVVAVPPLVYATTAMMLIGIRLPSVVRHAPLRDERRFYLEPWKNGEDSARRHITALDRAVPDGSAVIADFTILMPLLYAHRVEGWKPAFQLEMVDGRSSDSILASIAEHLEKGRRVFLLDDKPYYFPREISKRWELVPAGIESLLEVKALETTVRELK
jgi:hypothetical protein